MSDKADFKVTDPTSAKLNDLQKQITALQNQVGQMGHK
jgi:hypothetical protein